MLVQEQHIIEHHLPDGKTTVIADQVLVKLGKEGNDVIIDDILIFENKLRQTTDLSTNQRIAKNASELEIRSKNERIQLTRDSDLSPFAQSLGVEANDFNNLINQSAILQNVSWYKVYDTKSGDIIAGIELLN